MGVLLARGCNNKLYPYKCKRCPNGTFGQQNVYIIKHFKLQISKSSLFSGTGLSILSSTCISCSSIGFLLISTFGGLGIVVSNFLSMYQIQLRLLSIAILLFAIYSVHARIKKGCMIEYNNKGTST